MHTDLSTQLREYAGNNGYSHNDYADTMLEAARELDNLKALMGSLENSDKDNKHGT